MMTIRDLISAFFSNEILIFFYKIILASLLAGLLGIERERKGQAAGLRTHIILTLGAMLAMCLSYYLVKDYPSVSVDRIPGQVITGIGFLGAGAILHYGFTIKGLTTAAGLWTAAVIGLAVGAGYYLPAAITTLAVFFVISLLESIEKKMMYTLNTVGITIRLKKKRFDLQTLFREFREFKIVVHEISSLKEGDGDGTAVEFQLSCFRPIRPDEIMERIRQWDGVEGVIVKSESK